MMIKVTEANFDGVVSEGVSLIDLFAPWCGPCVTLSPIIEEISNEYPDVKVGKVDVDENSEIASKLSVRNIPTLLIYKDGSIVDRKTGIISKSDLKAMLDKHLV